MPLVYIVEDDENIAELISASLETAGIESRVFGEYSGFFAAMQQRLPQLALLDIMLPKMSGLDILRALKTDGRTSGVPVIFLTAKSAELDKVKGLELGAEDYITKPFGVLELIARVKTALRRGQPQPGRGETRRLDLRIDRAARRVYRGDEEIKLTFKEYELLCCLADNAGVVMSREQLLSTVWGFDFGGDTSRTVDMHIKTLRQKLGDNPDTPKYIFTVRGYGYRMGKE